MPHQLRPGRLSRLLLLSHFGLALLTLALASLLFLALAEGAGWLRWLLFTCSAALLTLSIVCLSRWLTRRIDQTFAGVTAAIDSVEAGEREGPDLIDAVDEEAVPVSQAVEQLKRRLSARIEQLEQDRQQLRTILSGMVEGVVALDAEQRILYANRRAAELLELPVPSPVGRRFWEVVRQRPLLDLVRRGLDLPEPACDEIVWHGAERSLTVHAARLPGVPPRGAVLVIHDTTELRRLERLRQDFVANVSHELKTPLSVIKVCAETLLDGAVDDPVHRGTFLERIAQQAERLHSLILDMLSLARIESGEEMLCQTVPLAPVVQACLERFQARAANCKQVLRAENMSPTDQGLAAWADEESLDQILDNLVDNALKYTPEGGTICVRWQADNGSVRLEVADTGIGIPEQDLARIFERFYRVDKARSRQLGGTGLGLSIVKHLVQAMRGEVNAVSCQGKGTTFRITLPRAGGVLAGAETVSALV